MPVATARLIGALLLSLAAVASLPAQRGPPSVASTDSVVKRAGAGYRASTLHRWLLGGHYRELWTMPIRVPVLNLKTFAGGLTASKAGGGKQTKSLRLIGDDGVEYVFRSVDKDDAALPLSLQGNALAEWVSRDQTSSSHPAAHLIVAPLLTAAGVLHGTPQLVAMPDDSALGEFQKVFGGRLGVLTPFPTEGAGDGPRFAAALEIIASDSLLQRLNRDPGEQVDARAYLTARLVDMLSNNYDRHPGNWKWARLAPAPEGLWLPISRDQDKVLITLDGLLPTLFRGISPTLIRFGPEYPSVRALTFNSLALDQRLLVGLSRATWDSVAASLTERLTDAVIDEALMAMPSEYAASAPEVAEAFRVRRDGMPAMADRFYHVLAQTVDVHGTEMPDVASVVHHDDGALELRLAGPDGQVWYQRRFVGSETSKLRLYLHGGDDRADVSGRAQGTIELTIIGGNGTNALQERDRDGEAHLVDQGTVRGVRYGEDTLWSRRPRVASSGGWRPAGREVGAAWSPTMAVVLNRDYGVLPSVGVRWRRYGFRRAPFATELALVAGHSFKLDGSRVALTVEHRRESSPWHWAVLAQASELELVNYHGLGNESPQSASVPIAGSAPRDDYFAVSQRQWRLQPALVRGLGGTTRLEFGPVAQWTLTDPTPGRYITDAAPYGSGRFGQLGVRAALRHDSRGGESPVDRGAVVDLSAAWYPAWWSATSAVASFGASAALHGTLPVPAHPVWRLRGSAQRVTGAFPYYQAAFLGGRADVRTLDLQRFAGDASLTAGLDIRIPVARGEFLVPWRLGLLASGDVGRVYVDGASPGGWHDAYGAGVSVTLHATTFDIRILRANETGRSAVITFRLAAEELLP
jgi:hypothetical protein